MNKKRQMLENWIYGLLGFEERTFIIVGKLVKDLLDNGFTGFKSEYIDYPDGETYQLNLEIKKIEPSDKPITVKIDAEEVLKKIQEEKQSLYDKLGRYPCKCKMEDIEWKMNKSIKNYSAG